MNDVANDRLVGDDKRNTKCNDFLRSITDDLGGRRINESQRQQLKENKNIKSIEIVFWKCIVWKTINLNV